MFLHHKREAENEINVFQPLITNIFIIFFVKQIELENGDCDNISGYNERYRS